MEDLRVGHENFDSSDDLKTIKYGYDVDFQGTGEILQVIAEPQDGDAGSEDRCTTARSSDQIYRQIPSSYVIQRTGDKPGKIVLTFDDGPDAGLDAKGPRHSQTGKCKSYIFHCRPKWPGKSGRW